jgi:anti-sigma factor RsiW
VSHSEIRARLSEYLERDLDPAERSRVEGHLAGCASCGRELRELRETVSLLRRLPEPGQPPALADAVMARIASQARAPGRLRLLLQRTSEPRIALALAATLAGLFLMFEPGDRTPALQPPVSYPEGTLGIASKWEAMLDPSFQRGVGGAAVISSATPADVYAAYRRRSEAARRLRSAGHPFSASLAEHFEAQPAVALAGWPTR